jgi:hypothetical protein
MEGRVRFAANRPDRRLNNDSELFGWYGVHFQSKVRAVFQEKARSYSRGQ